jgi:2-methylcitrate dehydratase PrpD
VGKTQSRLGEVTIQVTEDLADFAAGIHYKDLPQYVTQETKRLLLDTMGCAIGGVKTQKGKISIHLARALGGPAQAQAERPAQRVGLHLVMK